MTAARLGRLLAIPLLGSVLGLGGGAVHLATAAAPCTAASYTSHVTLVVEHGDGRVIGLCIGFDGSSITGEEVLQASGLEDATAAYGSLGEAVCQIDDEPGSYSACLPTSGSYWVVFVSRGGGAWEDAASGISTLTFASGDAEGFRYDPLDGPDPPPASPAGICAAALATPSAVASGAGSGSGSGAGAAFAPATGPATAPALPPAATTTTAGQTGSAGPPAGVIAAGDDPQRAGVGPAALAATGTGLSPGLLVVAAVFGVLAGLLVVQLLLRRRRT